jgi:N-acetylglucosamine-6-phosphate deacetylase
VRFILADGVGQTLDGKALASSAQGMDWMVREMHRATGCPLYEVVRMASAVPARIAGLQGRVGSIEPGKAADLVLLDEGLNAKRVFVDGVETRGVGGVGE